MTIPCRVSLDELAHDKGVQEYSEEDLRDAREELEEKLLAGERVFRIDLETLLEGEFDRNFSSCIRSLYEHFAGIGDCVPQERCLAGNDWMTQLVSAHLDAHPEVIEERAIEIAAARLEDSI